MWDFRWIGKYSDYLTLGLLFPASIAVGFFFGYWIDRWYHTDPWGKLLGFLLGAVSAFVSFYRDYQKLMKKERDESAKATKNPGADPKLRSDDPADSE